MSFCVYNPFAFKIGGELSAINGNVLQCLWQVCGVRNLYEEVLAKGRMPDVIKTVFVLHRGLGHDGFVNFFNSPPIWLANIGERDPANDGSGDTKLFLGYIQCCEKRNALVAWQRVPGYFDMRCEVVRAGFPNVRDCDLFCIASRFGFALHLHDGFVSVLGMTLGQSERILCNLSGGPSRICTLFANTCLTNYEDIRNYAGQEQKTGKNSQEPVRRTLAALMLSLLSFVLALLSFYFVKSAIDEEGVIKIWRLWFAVMLFLIAHVPGYLSLSFWSL